MFETFRKLHSFREKRLVLVVDDEMINREMLGMILSDQYEVLYAENGVKALEVIRENAEDLSLILLDVMMPEMDGFELLQILQSDEHLRHIPVIILTTEQSYEVRCLHLGASDFIKKPYELPEVILARIARTIALSENTYIIQTTEHDPLTGLYNQAFFFQYAEQFDRHHPGRSMDAAVVDIMHFHLLNELYGRETGNDLLKKLAVEALAFAREANGLVCRKEADTFFLYCPHLVSFEPLVERLEKALYDPKIRMPVQVRIGVYSEADQTISVPSRFDRAKLALDTVRASFVSKISFYDSEMHRQALLSQQLINEMENALEQKQFQVYYQPKYAILGGKPVLSSAEALIRWHHPELGMISPGIFIPLFENNGLISKLDHFVWKEAAAQIRRWRDQFGITLPVSVNISRVDLFDPGLIPLLRGLVKENGLTPSNLLLEITESAYTENSSQIIQIVEELRSLGFRIEMDDFGAGYSSLNMLSEMPTDIIKLDMGFIRNVFRNEKNLHILKMMIGIKNFLAVPIVAEGVETKEQYDLLRELGCDIVQGYYFSPPLPPEKLEPLMEERVALC